MGAVAVVSFKRCLGRKNPKPQAVEGCDGKVRDSGFSLGDLGAWRCCGPALRIRGEGRERSCALGASFCCG